MRLGRHRRVGPQRPPRQRERPGPGSHDRVVLPELPRLPPPGPAAVRPEVPEPRRARAGGGDGIRELAVAVPRAIDRIGDDEQEDDERNRHGYERGELPARQADGHAGPPPVLVRHSEIRDPRHNGTRKQEADREPEPLAQPLVVGLAVLDETGLLKRPEAEQGGRNEGDDERRGRLDPLPSQRDERRRREQRDDDAASRIGEQHHDDGGEGDDDRGHAQEPRMLPPHRRPQRERQASSPRRARARSSSRAARAAARSARRPARGSGSPCPGAPRAARPRKAPSSPSATARTDRVEAAPTSTPSSANAK